MPLYKVTPSQYAGFLSVFNRSSCNGLLGHGALKSILERAGIAATTTQIQQMIECISVDSRGIDFQGFIDLVSAYTSLRDVDGEYADAFRIYDRTGSGHITKEDISYVMEKLGLKFDVDSMFKEIGNAGDAIEYDDFVSLMKKRM